MIRVDVEKKLRFSDGIKKLKVEVRIEGECFMGISGDSGIGKTTFLRMIAGLTRPDTGIVEVSGNTWFSSSGGIDLHPSKRSVGYVPQEYSLFPNMTVRENVRYAASDGGCVNELLEMVEMESFSRCYPEGLSGGQKQRVALARALARGPELILMDEPFAAVDCRIKGKLCGAIQKIYRRFAIPVFLVSHNREVLKGLSDVNMEIERREGMNYGRVVIPGGSRVREAEDTIPGGLLNVFAV